MRINSFLPRALVFLAAGMFTACCGSDAPQPSEKDEQDTRSAHGHPTEGPHGGHLIVLGNDEYRAELLHDDATGKVTVHLLDHDAKKPVEITESEITIQLLVGGENLAHVLKAEGGERKAENGGWSEFEIVDAELCTGLCDEEVDGRLQVSIDGKPYSGTLGHEDHDDHDADGAGHGEEDADEADDHGADDDDHDH